MNHKYYPLLCSALLLFGFGCATTSTTKPAAAAKPAAAPAPAAAVNETNTFFAAPTQLTATLSAPTTNGCDATLRWQNNATAEGGNWVEFSTPGSDYTKLEVFLDPRATMFIHPRLAPQTQFIYHIQPFFGKATAPVEITTGAPTTNTVDLEEGPLPATNAPPVDMKSQTSIRSINSFAQAMPVDLTAALSSPSSVDLRWTDRASDEDGFLVELAAHPAGPFVVCALLPADTASFRKIALPTQTPIYFRVRAFFYSKPSDTASVTTP